MVDDTLRVRIGEVDKQLLKKMAEQEGYEDVSSYVRAILRIHLHPEVERERLKNQLISLLRSDPDFRRELGLEP